MANDNIVWDDEKPDAGIVWDDAPKPTKQPASVLKRALAGLADPVIGVGQLIDRAARAATGAGGAGQTNMDDVVRQREAEYQAPEGIDWARMAGNVANPINYIGGGPGLTRAIAAGAAQGAMAPVVSDDFYTEKAKQAAAGAGFGAGGHALARTLGGMVRPTPEARTLMDRGVALTPGQAAGPGTRTNRLEQLASSNPVAGLPIRNAQRRAVQESNVAAAQTVANVVDENIRLGLPPAEAIERTRDAISRTYDRALEGMSVPGFVPETFMWNVFNRSANDFPMLEQAQINQMERFITQRVGNMVRNAGDTLDGQMLKQLDSELGAHIRNLRSSTNAADKTAAPAWAELQQSLREVMELGHANPEQATMLRNANAAYRQLLALEKARLPGAEQFTPRQLARQVEKGNLGNTPLGDVSRAMSATLPNTVPDSGTAERLLANALPAALIGGGVGAQGMGWDTVGAGLIGAGALGSRPGSRFVTGGYGWQPRAEMLINALRQGVVPATRGDGNERK